MAPNGKKKEPNKTGSRCIEVWAIPPEVYQATTREERVALLESMAQQTEDGPFPPNSLTTPAPISILEETVVLLSLGVQLGGPLVWAFTMFGLVFVGTWTQLGTAMAISYGLAYHPMPSRLYATKNIVNSWWTRCLYKYFTYRFVWTGDSHELIQDAKPWIGAAVSKHNTVSSDESNMLRVVSISPFSTTFCLCFVAD